MSQLSVAGIPGESATPAAPGRSQRYPPTPWSAQRLYRPFVRAAFVVAILLGCITGSGMLVAESAGVDRGTWWLTHAQAHGMAQIFGFAGLFTMGIAFHVVPRFRNGSMRFPWPQRLVLWSILAAVVLRFGGQSINEHPVTGLLAVISGVLLLLGALLFVATVSRSLLGGSGAAGAVERWIYAAMLWLVVASSIHLALGWWLFDQEASIAPYFLNSAVINAGLFGFIGSFVMGVSTRAVVGFLGLRPTRTWLEITGFLVVQAGVGITVFSQVFEASVDITATGRLMLAAGIVMFVVALRVLEPSSTRRPPISPGAYPRFGWFVRSAYTWLLVGAVFIGIEAIEVIADNSVLPAERNSPVLHIVTMGYVISVIVGMGCRMIPLFEGSILPGHRLLDVAFVLLALSIVTRTAGGFTSGSLADSLLGISGSASLVALVLVSIPVFRTMRESARAKYRRLAENLGRSRLTLQVK